MNSKGGNLTYVSDFQSPEMQVFRGGLRHLPANADHAVKDSKQSMRNFHDKISYERGFIQHSRSPSNQYFNFHYMFGGFRKYVVERLFYQTWYRRNFRNWWAPVLMSYTLACLGMRMYDNAAYDYFYFIE